MRSRLAETMLVWGWRYLRVGACIGLILCYFMSTTIPHLLINLLISPMYGALIGAGIGSAGGAFSCWIKSNVKEKSLALASWCATTGEIRKTGGMFSR